jgi:hypothetical protein
VARFALILLLLSGVPGISSPAQDPNPQIVLSPANPTSNDSITFVLSGVWHNGCVPQSPRVSVSAAAVRIETSNPGSACVEALTPWTLSGPIGKLAPGDYSLIVVCSGPTVPATVEILRKSLSVAPSSLFNEVVMPVVVNGAFADKLHYQTIFTILNTTAQIVRATLQVYGNAGTTGGVFCSPLAPPPSSLTATLNPGALSLQFTSADLPFLDGWARLSWEGPLLSSRQRRSHPGCGSARALPFDLQSPIY